MSRASMHPASCGQSWRRWSLAIAALLLPASGHAAPCVPASVRAMSYNIRLDLASDGDNRWERRRDFLIGQVAMLRPDVVGFQEVVAGQRADLVRDLPAYIFLGVARDDGRAAGEYSNLAVRRDRFRLRSSGTFWLSPTPDKPSKGWDAAYPRIATWAHLADRRDGRTLLAINTHFDHLGRTARLESARQIKRWMAAHRERGEALLMTGDLNSEPSTPPIAVLTQGPAALRDGRAASEAPAIGPDGTFNEFQALPATSPRIDYILMSPEWRVERSATLAWHGKNGRVASDHFPIVADLVRTCPR